MGEACLNEQSILHLPGCQLERQEMMKDAGRVSLAEITSQTLCNTKL